MQCKGNGKAREMQWKGNGKGNGKEMEKAMEKAMENAIEMHWKGI